MSYSEIVNLKPIINLDSLLTTYEQTDSKKENE